MRIGISGASGRLGLATLSELQQHGNGHAIIGISRTPERIAAPVEGRHGDYDQPESLSKAYQNLDRLLIIPSSDLRPGVRGAQLRAAIDAAVHAGVGHIFLVSAAGTHEVADPSLGAAYWVAEQHLIKNAPRWTILRMNYYAESMAEEIQMSKGAEVLAGLGDERVAFVSRDDLAAAAAGALLGDGHAGAIYNPTGPAIVTGPDRAAILSEIFGKPFQYVVITKEQLRAGLTQANLPEPIIDVFCEIKTDFVNGKFDILTGDLTRLSGRTPKSLRDVLAASLL